MDLNMNISNDEIMKIKNYFQRKSIDSESLDSKSISLVITKKLLQQ